MQGILLCNQRLEEKHGRHRHSWDGHRGSGLNIWGIWRPWRYEYPELGSEVSQYVKEVFVGVLKGTEEFRKKNYAKALDLTFKKIDEMIDSEEGESKLDKMRLKNQRSIPINKKVSQVTGCTANVVLITRSKYIVANIGDSRCALWTDGQFVPLSKDHKPKNS